MEVFEFVLARHDPANGLQKHALLAVHASAEVRSVQEIEVVGMLVVGSLDGAIVGLALFGAGVGFFVVGFCDGALVGLVLLGAGVANVTA